MEEASIVLKELEEISEKYSLPSIGPEKAKVIKKVIEEHKPKKILEVGTLYGYSAIFMASCDKNIKVVTIEKNKKACEIAKRYIKKAKLSKRIKVINGDALEVLKKIKGKFDLVFLDAVKEEYLDYLKLVEKNLRKGSVVIADNTGIFKFYLNDYLNYVRKSGKYKSYSVKTKLEFSKIEDEMEISIFISP